MAKTLTGGGMKCSKCGAMATVIVPVKQNSAESFREFWSRVLITFDFRCSKHRV